MARSSAGARGGPESGLLGWTVMRSPVGRLLVVGGESGLRLVSFMGTGSPRAELDALARRGLDVVAAEEAPRRVAALSRRAVRQLDEYFRGTRRDFSLDLAPRGTPFQEKVWRKLEAIPFGGTWSYGRLARAVGRPGASRAVGAANGANPIPVILPCHRVIGANGSLTGYGGGLERKRWLLEHEGRQVGTVSGRLFDGGSATTG